MFPPVEIMDTTLRDGEQTSGVSFNAREKLSIARLLLEELHVSRIEIASARVSQGEQQAVRAIAEWAAAKGYADRVEALGFIDGGVSLDWLGTAGCRVVNLLAKGSRKHCEGAAAPHARTASGGCACRDPCGRRPRDEGEPLP